jgi:HAD superfamily hydrolase (TIGR01509 family)
MRALLFDMDGVLVETYAVWHALINAFARERGYPEVSDEAMTASWGQGVDADARTFFAGTAATELEAFYNARFFNYLDELSVMPGAGRVVARVRSAGLLTAVVTNTPAPLASALLRRAQVEPDVLVGGTDVPRPKPAPDIVLRACELLGVPVGEVAVVGDSDFDRRAAKAAGTRFIGFRCPGDDRVDELQELPRLVGA